MDNTDFQEALKKSGFSDSEMKYFCQTIDEKPALKFILRTLPVDECKIVLDVGCGVGLFEDNIPKDKPIILVGLDAIKKYLSVAKSRSQSQEFILGSAYCLPFKKYSFDIVIAHDVLYGISLSKFLDNAAATLKPNGKAYFDLPNQRFYKFFPSLLPFPTFITYDLTKVKNLLHQHGLEAKLLFAPPPSKLTLLKFGISFHSLPVRVASAIFEKLPIKFHILLCKFWFLMVLICQKRS